MKKIFKTTLSALLSLILCFSFIASAAASSLQPSASDGDAPTKEKGVHTVETDSVSFETAYAEYVPMDQIDTLFTVEALLREALLNGETKVELEHLHINSDAINLHSLSAFSPYIPPAVEFVPYFHRGEDYTYIDIKKTVSPDVAAAYFAEVDAKLEYVRAILSNAKSDIEKALLLHDYLVYSAEYDYDNYMNDTIPNESYSSAGVLLFGKGVCQSYCYAYMYILTLEGMECHVTSSESMGHAWNILKIDGQYYHIDVTWDDPVRDRVGRVYHRHFLRSDKAFLAGDEDNSIRAHHDWAEDSPKCTSTKYDDAYWIDISSAIVSEGDLSYYVKDDAIYMRSSTTGEETELVNPGSWKVWQGSGRWVGAYSGIALISGEVYYNTPTEIRKINLSTLKDSAVFVPDTSEGYIYGFVIDGSALKYTISISPNESGTVHTAELDLPSSSNVVLNKSKVTVNVGESLKLLPLGITTDLTWVSSDPAVVTVDSDGTLTAVAEGSATVTVTAKNGSSSACNVTVRDVKIIDSAEKFTDLEVKSWSKDGIDYVVSYGYMNGTGNGTTFDQTGTMTRAMIVSVLHRMAEKPAPSVSNPFTDLEAGQSWYHEAVIWAYEFGIVTGTSKTTFAPTGAVTREQMATFLYRYAKHMGCDTSASADLTAFPDEGKVGSWAKEALAWANAEGLITGAKGSDGVTRLDPQGMATREQVATILMRFCKAMEM